MRPYYRRRLKSGATRVYLRSGRERLVLDLDADVAADVPSGHTYTVEQYSEPCPDLSGEPSR